MPDFANRSEWEARLVRALSRMQQRELKRLIEALGDPPDLNNLAPEFWNEFSTSARRELMPILEQVFLESAQGMLTTTSIGVDWALVNESAARWSEQYTYDLVSGLTNNTRSALQAKIPAYYRQGLSVGSLTDSLQSLFGPVRAEMIAATEITRSASAGQRAIVGEIQKQGIQMIAVWNTSNDAFTCPICAPRNQKRQGDGWFTPPPAHPRCRCHESFEFAE